MTAVRPGEGDMERMTRRQILGALSTVFALSLRALAQTPPAVRVYKDPTCGCCGLWVEHLRKAGFAATVTEVDDIAAIKMKYGVPPRVGSCHTALVGNYVLEGHVPAEDIQRLLKERPDIVGIGVPGMPIGSPGMEVAGMKPTAYDVLAFDKAGKTRVFASHGR